MSKSWISGIAGALALSLAALAGPANAFVVTFPQNSLVLANFDLTGATPGPLFDFVELTIPRDGGSNGMSCSVYADVLATPADLAQAQTVTGCASASTVTYTYSNPEMLDGLFSIGFFLGPSNFAGIANTVTDPFAVGIRNGQRSSLVFGTLVPGQDLVNPVGEPSTLALVGVALIAAFRRRRG